MIPARSAIASPVAFEPEVLLARPLPFLPSPQHSRRVCCGTPGKADKAARPPDFPASSLRRPPDASLLSPENESRCCWPLPRARPLAAFPCAPSPASRVSFSIVEDSLRRDELNEGSPAPVPPTAGLARGEGADFGPAWRAGLSQGRPEESSRDTTLFARTRGVRTSSPLEAVEEWPTVSSFGGGGRRWHGAIPDRRVAREMRPSGCRRNTPVVSASSVDVSDVPASRRARRRSLPESRPPSPTPPLALSRDTRASLSVSVRRRSPSCPPWASVCRRSRSDSHSVPGGSWGPARPTPGASIF